MTRDHRIDEPDLHAYVDGALPAPRRAEVEAMLDQHPELAQRIAGHVRQRAELRAALAPIADEPVPPTLSVARLVAARPVPRRAPWRRPLIAMAAAALVALGGVAGWLLRGDVAARPAGGVAALADEATDNYRVYAQDRVHPVELRAADQHELVAWVSAHLAYPVTVPDLTRTGFRFMGGRVVATPHGAAGLLMYDDDRGTRMVVLIRPMAVERDTPMSPHAAGAVRGYSWARRGIGFSVVAEASATSLHSLADEVRRQADAPAPG